MITIKQLTTPAIAGQPVQFQATISDLSIGFGDSTVASNVVQFSHTFFAPGTYPIGLTIHIKNQSDIGGTKVIVQAAPQPAPIPTPSPPPPVPAPIPAPPPPAPAPTPTPAPPPPVIGRRLLQQSDFVYERSFVAPISVYGTGLTHRYVNGQVRLIALEFAGNLPGVYNKFLPVEFDGNGTKTNQWDMLFPDPTTMDGNGCYHSLWFDQQRNTLHTSSAFDYPQSTVTTNETSFWMERTLPDSGGNCISHNGWWGVQGIGQRAIFGKLQRVPQWYQSQYGYGPYISLSGGYTSRMNQGLGSSLGPMFIFLASPFGSVQPTPFYQSSGAIPNLTAQRIAADCRNASPWYPNYAGRTSDRGIRSTPVVNWFDGNDNRQNPPTRPVYPDNFNAPGTWWTDQNGGPAPNDPDNLGRWVWADSFYGNNNWIDNDAGTLGCHGILGILATCKGYAWYQTGSLYQDHRGVEFQIYDPADLANPSIQPWNLRPKTCFEIPLPGMDMSPSSGGMGTVQGATFDSVNNKLYLIGYWSGTTDTKVYQFSINTSG